jgi:transcription factor SPN1
MSDYGSDAPPLRTFGDDRPSDIEDALNDTAPGFNEPDSALPATTTMDDSDDDSLLSEVDEAQFADFDATAVQIAPDLETLNRTIKAKKRKRPEGEDAMKPKKRKEGTREKVKKNRRKVDSDDGFSGGEEIEGKRSRKSKPGTDGQKERKRRAIEDEINDEDLTPEERRRRALDRAMDAALKKSTARRFRKGEIVRSHFCGF